MVDPQHGRTFCYHKPQAGRLRMLLGAGADNLLTPLVEITSSAGSVVPCQLDVTNRYGLDPAMTLLVNRMLAHYVRRTTVAARSAVMVGNAETEALAKRLGFATTEAESSVIALRPGAVSAEAISRAAEAVRIGATCLVLAGEDGAALHPLKGAALVTFDCGSGEAVAVSLAGAPGLLAGLSASDFYYPARPGRSATPPPARACARSSRHRGA